MPRTAELSAAITTDAPVIARHATQEHDAGNRAIANRSVFLFLRLKAWGRVTIECPVARRGSVASLAYAT
jgi:hypothetical protein